MTDEQINIAIAEACGWKHEEGESVYSIWNYNVSPSGQRHDCDFGRNRFAGIPNYCHDLNAMAEAEGKVMATIGEMGAYISALQPIMEREQWGWPDFKELIRHGADTIAYGLSPYIRATARQRAEAFCRALDLWNEEA